MICTGLGGLWFILGARGYLDRFHCSIIHTHTHTPLFDTGQKRWSEVQVARGQSGGGEGGFVQHNEPARHKSLIVESDPIQSNPTQPFNARDDFRARVSTIERVALHYRLRDPPREQITDAPCMHARKIPGYPIADPGPGRNAMHAPRCMRSCLRVFVQLAHPTVAHPGRSKSREMQSKNPSPIPVSGKKHQAMQVCMT